MLLQRTIAFLLLLAFFTSTFSRLFVVADYYVNTERYYAKCVNKARPQLKCNGKCQMSKKIQAEENKEQKNPGLKLDLKSELVTHIAIELKPGVPLTTASICYPVAQQEFLPTGYNARIFHPPAA